MLKKLSLGLLAVVPLGVTGLVFANAGNGDAQDVNTTTQVAESAFVCPLTGEELPCPNCCPLNKE